MFVTAIALVSFHAKVVWTPKPYLLPLDFVRAANFLLNHGLEDPRGCEMRAAKYNFGVPTMNRGYAWIRPGRSSQDKSVINAYGVKVETTGVGEAVSASKFLPKLQPESDNGFPSHDSFDKENALELMMLAIHGEEKLVSRQLDLVVKTRSGSSENIPLQALQAFKATLYHASAQAFKNGDFDQALRFIKMRYDDEAQFDQEVTPEFRLFGENPELRSELFTRVRNRATQTIPMAKIATQPVRDQVPLLIEKLAELGDHGESDNFSGSSVYRRIKEIGVQAVPALLVALKQNKRISRLGPLSFDSRTISSPLQFITVKSIVRQILNELGNTHNQLSDDQLIAFWEKKLS